jgi:hypothetical protein
MRKWKWLFVNGREGKSLISTAKKNGNNAWVLQITIRSVFTNADTSLEWNFS